jgi:hypothetical protein
LVKAGDYTDSGSDLETIRRLLRFSVRAPFEVKPVCTENLI